MIDYVLNIITSGLLSSDASNIITNGFILEQLWSEAAPIIEEIINSGQIIDKINNLSKEEKKKIIKLILWYKDLKVEQSIEVKKHNIKINNINLVNENYKINISDINNLINEYKNLKNKNNISIKIDNIKLN